MTGHADTSDTLLPVLPSDLAAGQTLSVTGGGGGGGRAAVRSLLWRRSRAELQRRLESSPPAIWERDEHGPAAPAAQPSGAAGPGDGPTQPGRPTRRVVLAAVCGVALLSVPFLVIGMHSHGDKPHETAYAKLPQTDRPEPGPLGAGPLSASHTSSPSPSRTPSHSHKPGAAAARQPHQAPTSSRPTQAFGGADHVLLKNLATGMCADLPQYGHGQIAGVIDQYDCQAGSKDNQMWSLNVVGSPKGPGDASLFTISNDTDHLCMDIPWYGIQPSGSRVTEYTCDSSTADNQLWYRAPGEGDHYRLRNYASDSMCLGVAGGKSTHGVSLVVESCRSASDDWAMVSG